MPKYSLLEFTIIPLVPGYCNTGPYEATGTHQHGALTIWIQLTSWPPVYNDTQLLTSKSDDVTSGSTPGREPACSGTSHDAMQTPRDIMECPNSGTGIWDLTRRQYRYCNIAITIYPQCNDHLFYELTYEHVLYMSQIYLISQRTYTRMNK